MKMAQDKKCSCGRAIEECTAEDDFGVHGDIEGAEEEDPRFGEEAGEFRGAHGWIPNTEVEPP
jgi:hypothetical protein